MNIASELRCSHCGAEVLSDDYACPNCRRILRFERPSESKGKPRSVKPRPDNDDEPTESRH